MESIETSSDSKSSGAKNASSLPSESDKIQAAEKEANNLLHSLEKHQLKVEEI